METKGKKQLAEICQLCAAGNLGKNSDVKYMLRKNKLEFLGLFVSLFLEIMTTSRINSTLNALKIGESKMSHLFFRRLF